MLGEFGITEPLGIWHLGRLQAHLKEDASPDPGCQVLLLLVEQLDEIEARVKQINEQILLWHRAKLVSKPLAKILGVGPLIASAVVATVAGASLFKSCREFAAWLGLVARKKSTGGKPRLGRITRQGDTYIRRLLVIGAQSALHRPRR